MLDAGQSGSEPFGPARGRSEREPARATLPKCKGKGIQTSVDQPILGYADALSMAPGSTLTFHISAPGGFDAECVRLLDGPSVDGSVAYKAVPSDVQGRWPGSVQRTHRGSYCRVDNGPALLAHGATTVQLWVMPTMSTEQAIIATESGSSGFGLTLMIASAGDLVVRLSRPGQDPIEARTGVPVCRRSWHFVAVRMSLKDRSLELIAVPAERHRRGARTCARARADLHGPEPGGEQAWVFGAFSASSVDRSAPPTGCFNGKLERPAVWHAALSDAELEHLLDDADPLTVSPRALAALWDFGRDVSSSSVTDVSGNGANGRVIGAPTRACTGHRWMGEHLDFSTAPSEYGAIHFHDDDLEDAGWQPTLALNVPLQWESGVYGLRLQSAENADTDIIPFIVTPSRCSRAEAALLLPTYTYMAYANMRYDTSHLERLKRVAGGGEIILERHDAFIDEHPELGLSLYEHHRDGTITCYSSARRPIMNMRPDYRNSLTDAPRHFAADLTILGWLGRRGAPFDVVTDAELHREGTHLLKQYRTVLTGNHPEYVTAPMWNALYHWTQSGGRLMYIGGNGFYWVTSVDAERPHLIEVRRGHAGSRPGSTEPGEGYHSTTGEPGGHWRFRGKPPQVLVGVGFTAAGIKGGAAYRVTPSANDPRCEFIFDGVDVTEPIGAFGPMGGAAGDELDRADAELGTPPEAIVLATSKGHHDDLYQGTLEDTPEMSPEQGGTTNPRVRSDIVLVQTPGGGMVFAVGSITWCLGLNFNGDDNNVSRITENVLRRFLTADGTASFRHEAAPCERPRLD